MGMFNDYRSPNRDNWRFSYLGKELADAARVKYDNFTAQEKEARHSMAEMLKDANVRASDPRIEDLKQSIERFGSEREKCLVWVHEFARQPQKEYSLALSDVSYFDLAKLPE